MTIAPKIAVDHYGSERFRVLIDHPAFGVYEQWIPTPAGSYTRTDEGSETARWIARAEQEEKRAGK